MRICILIFGFLFIFSCKSSKTNSSSARVSTPKNNKNIAKEAKMYIGIKYKSGGKSPETGFDCSGFTKYIFKSYNIILQNTAASQALQGRPVFIGDAEYGDLIFFKGSDVNSNKVGHVGIVISDKGKPVEFVHASTSKGIMQSTLEEKYFKARFVKIRRVL